MKLPPFLFAATILLAQPSSPPSVIYVTSDPAGACVASVQLRFNTSNGKLWGCNALTWGQIGGSGSGTVSSATANQLAYYTAATTVGGSGEYVTDLSTIMGPVFIGTGLNDFSFSGAYTDGVNNPGSQYIITIDGTGTPNTFSWAQDGGALTSGVAMTGSAQLLSNGISARFAATTGHHLGDVWQLNTVVGVSVGTFNEEAPTALLKMNNVPMLHTFPDRTNIYLGRSAGNFTNRGTDNIGIGFRALTSTTTGLDNIAIGEDALRRLSVFAGSDDSNQNIAIGLSALTGMLGGNGNIAIGVAAMSVAGTTAASYPFGNVVIGQGAAQNGTFSSSSSYNTMIGQAAGSSFASGNNNVFLGSDAGITVTGSANVLIGFAAGSNQTTLSNKLIINDRSFSASDELTHALIIGDFADTPASQTITFNVGSIGMGGCTAATLPTTNSAQCYCTDCKVTSGSDNTCVGSGGGAMSTRIGGASKCLQ